jgi:hypothetical protein
VIARMDTLWSETVANSQAIQQYALENGSIFSPVSGKEAQAMAQAAVRETAWRMFDDGRTRSRQT